MKENDKTSHRAELMRDIVAMVNQNPVLKQAWQRKKEKSIQNTEFEYPEHLSVEHIDMGLFKMEYLTWNGSEAAFPLPFHSRPSHRFSVPCHSVAHRENLPQSPSVHPPHTPSA
jgi:hypothetical protein